MSKTKEKVQWAKVKYMSAIEWTSKAGYRMIRISYGTDLVDYPIHEWINPNSSPTSPLGRKYASRAEFFGIPNLADIDEAIEHINNSNPPDRIKVRDGDFFNILRLANGD